MRPRLPVFLALLFGGLHALAVGIPFISHAGGGEGLLYVVIVDFPLFLAAEMFAGGLLYNSKAFNFFLFPVVGTVMYSVIGYIVGHLILVIRGRPKPGDGPAS